MNKITLTLLFHFIILFFYGQKDNLCKLTGPAKLIGSCKSNQKFPKTFTSSTSDTFKFYQAHVSTLLAVTYKNTSEILLQTDVENFLIEVYEFDFDNNSDKEIIVFGYDSHDIFCKVYKTSKGLVKLIGNFKPQFEVIISKEFISFPYGGQGLSDDYYFKDDAFFELIYHDPNKK